MNFKKTTFIAALTLLGGAAMAQGSSGDVWAKFQNITPSAAHQLSRAEVLAELEIYQRSGLAQLERNESVNPFDPSYLQAQARYQGMRSSPEFSALVAQIKAARGDAPAQ